MRELGRAARGPGTVFITGGGCSVLLGWRTNTVDIDVRFDPEPAGVFEAIPKLKRTLDVNVELASPQDFLPPVPGWRERSRHIATEGQLEFFHYDFVSQALSKIERGHTKDVADVAAMLADGFATEEEIRDALEAIEPQLIRYPSIDGDALRQKVDRCFPDAND